MIATGLPIQLLVGMATIISVFPACAAPTHKRRPQCEARPSTCLAKLRASTRLLRGLVRISIGGLLHQQVHISGVGDNPDREPLPSAAQLRTVRIVRITIVGDQV